MKGWETVRLGREGQAAVSGAGFSFMVIVQNA